MKRTFVPQKTVAVPHFALADLREVEYTDTQTNIVKHAIGVLFVQFARNRVLWRQPKMHGMDCDCILQSISPRIDEEEIVPTLMIDRTNIPSWF